MPVRIAINGFGRIGRLSFRAMRDKAGKNGWKIVREFVIAERHDRARTCLGGGCQGCGMVNVTLKQGVEAIWNHLLRYRADSASRTIGQAAPTRGGSYTLVQFHDEVRLLGFEVRGRIVEREVSILPDPDEGDVDGVSGDYCAQSPALRRGVRGRSIDEVGSGQLRDLAHEPFAHDGNGVA